MSTIATPTNALLLSDGDAATTANGVGQVNGQAGIVDLGANHGQWNGVLILNVNALNLVTGDETYILVISGSNDKNVWNVLGQTSVATTGQQLLNIQNYISSNTNYEYLQISYQLAGTNPSITLQSFVEELSALSQYNLADLIQLMATLFGAFGAAIDDIALWMNGAANGGPNSAQPGYYPISNSQGNVVYVPCPALMIANISSGVTTNLNNLLTEINNELSSYEAQVGDLAAASQSAYTAQQYELAAQAAALAARISYAMSLPSDFALGTQNWTNGNGQIAAPDVAYNFPLAGTFVTVANVGQVYQTEANPESCNSFGNLGYIVGIPGSTIKVTAPIRCIVDDTSNAVTPNTGVGLLPLNADFSLKQYIQGGGLGKLTSQQGTQTATFTYEVPTDGTAAPYYRGTGFYNVAGSTTSPLSPSNAVQGNAQFQFDYLLVEVILPGEATGTNSGGTTTTSDIVLIPQIAYLNTVGTGAYTTPANCVYIDVELKASGGGGGGSGTGATSGGNGDFAQFGNYVVYGGGGGEGGAHTYSGYNQGGYGGSLPTNSTTPLDIAIGGQAGVGIGGFQYAAGPKGAGDHGGIGTAGAVGQDGLDGCGGAGGGSNSHTPPGGSGGEGARGRKIISGGALAGSFYYKVPAGGIAGVAGTDLNSSGQADDFAGGKGGDGWIKIIAYCRATA